MLFNTAGISLPGPDVGIPPNSSIYLSLNARSCSMLQLLFGNPGGGGFLFFFGFFFFDFFFFDLF